MQEFDNAYKQIIYIAKDGCKTKKTNILGSSSIRNRTSNSCIRISSDEPNVLAHVVFHNLLSQAIPLHRKVILSAAHKVMN